MQVANYKKNARPRNAPFREQDFAIKARSGRVWAVIRDRWVGLVVITATGRYSGNGEIWDCLLMLRQYPAYEPFYSFSQGCGGSCGQNTWCKAGGSTRLYTRAPCTHSFASRGKIRASSLTIELFRWWEKIWEPWGNLERTCATLHRERPELEPRTHQALSWQCYSLCRHAGYCSCSCCCWLKGGILDQLFIRSENES